MWRYQYQHPHPRRPRRAEVAAALALFAPLTGTGDLDQGSDEGPDSDEGPGSDEGPRAAPAPAPGGQPGNRNSRRGTAVEGMRGGAGALAALHREGYLAFRLDQRWGAVADIIAVGTQDGDVRLVEVKRARVFSTAPLVRAVEKFLSRPLARRLPDGATWEAWLWLDRHGWAVKVIYRLSSASELVVHGESPLRDAVRSALAARWPSLIVS